MQLADHLASALLHLELPDDDRAGGPFPPAVFIFAAADTKSCKGGISTCQHRSVPHAIDQVQGAYLNHAVISLAVARLLLAHQQRVGEHLARVHRQLVQLVPHPLQLLDPRQLEVLLGHPNQCLGLRLVEWWGVRRVRQVPVQALGRGRAGRDLGGSGEGEWRG